MHAPENNTLNLPPLPDRIAKLPKSPRGYPVPWFVTWIDGLPEFRMVRPEKIHLAVKKRLCWICGEKMGKAAAFVIGPMCAVNHNNAEPPSHPECARFAVKACPFMLRPGMTRREDDRTRELGRDAAGMMIMRNPGCMAIWVTKIWKTIKDPSDPEGRHILFRFGAPNSVTWWREGRPATFAEVKESIDTGIHFLLEVCADDGERDEVQQAIAATMGLVKRTATA